MCERGNNMIQCFAAKIRAEEPFKIYVAIKSHYHSSPHVIKRWIVYLLTL